MAGGADEMSHLPRNLSGSGKSLGATLAVVAMALLSAPSPAAAAVPQGPPSLSGGVSGQVYATLVVGDTVYVGGSFGSAQQRNGPSTTRGNVAAFSRTTGALITSWRSDANATVRALATDGSSLYIGGAFTSIGGTGTRFLAKVSLATGAVDTGFRPNVNQRVYGLAAAGGSVYAGGNFTSVGGSSQPYLAKLDASTGALDAGWAGRTDGPVNAVALSPDGSQLAVAGDFSQLSGQARNSLGLVNSASGVAGREFATTVRPMLTVSWRSDGSRLFGGSGNINNLAASWNPVTGSRGWHMRVGGDVQAIGYADGEVYVGFHDNYEGNPQTKLLAVDADSGAVNQNFRPTFDKFMGVRSISASDNGLIVGGQFTVVSGVWAHGWARWPA
jgi:WD40 repeat protein